MLTCKQVCENATELGESDVGALQRLMLVMHLTICKHCRRFVRQLELAHGVYRHVDSPGEAPGDDEIDKLIDRLRQ